MHKSKHTRIHTQPEHLLFIYPWRKAPHKNSEYSIFTAFSIDSGHWCVFRVFRISRTFNNRIITCSNFRTPVAYVRCVCMCFRVYNLMCSIWITCCSFYTKNACNDDESHISKFVKLETSTKSISKLWIQNECGTDH